jgi:DNA repair exonuclease SbcCD ATPase subunit
MSDSTTRNGVEYLLNKNVRALLKKKTGLTKIKKEEIIEEFAKYEANDFTEDKIRELFIKYNINYNDTQINNFEKFKDEFYNKQLIQENNFTIQRLEQRLQIEIQDKNQLIQNLQDQNQVIQNQNQVIQNQNQEIQDLQEELQQLKEETNELITNENYKFSYEKANARSTQLHEKLKNLENKLSSLEKNKNTEIQELKKEIKKLKKEIKKSKQK